MIHTFETLPNEILLNIFGYLSWDNILISFWSLNKRMNSLVYSILSMDKYEISFNQPDLSYKKLTSILLPLIYNSSILCSLISYIHFDGAYSNSYIIARDFLFNNINKQILYFSNLKSIKVTRCLLSQSLIQTLSLLIQNHLNQLTLTFDENLLDSIRQPEDPSKALSYTRKSIMMLKQLIRQFFSNKCQLESLRLDIADDNVPLNIHQSLLLSSHPSSKSISQYSCLTLRHLYVCLKYTYFLEHLINHIPNIERLSVSFKQRMNFLPRSASKIETLIKSSGNWFEKVPKLTYFTLKAFAKKDLEFAYLKWMLNNLNHMKKFKLHLQIHRMYSSSDILIREYVVDANFIHQYCLPDFTMNINDFQFYIVSECQLLISNIEKIIDSFKVHEFFTDHQQTNVTCLFDPLMSYQHLSSSNVRTLQFMNGLHFHANIFTWPHIQDVSIDLHPSLYLFLERFNEIYPNVSHIKVYTECYRDMDQPDLAVSLRIPFEIGQCKVADIQLRNVTRLDLGFCQSPMIRSPNTPLNVNKTRAKIFAHLISMPVQLKYLLVEKIEWLYHIIQYASDELKQNALSSVRYADFGIPSCHYGCNESIHIGKKMIPFVSTHMPRLQTMHLWRPDDFPWTSIRPDIKPSCFKYVNVTKWIETLKTSESIAQHAHVFEEDLSQLIEQLKELVFLDIHGKVGPEKLESYRSMAEKRFPSSKFEIGLTRFRLWI